MNIDNHPCFNDKVRHKFGRIHLPVAPRCNIQCNFCNRKYDCVNESRPGVTSGVLEPYQAIRYLDHVMSKKKNISVVGIAGPGDPFANADETLQTLALVRAQYQDMLLCVATNGLNLSPYVDELARLKVSHVSVTVNAVDPAIAEPIYAWVRKGKRVVRAAEGAKTLLENQLAGIEAMKNRGLTVKINTIVLPGINDHHVEAVAEKMARLKVDILNCIPYYPNEGANFGDMKEPGPEIIKKVRKAAGKHIPQMHHCTRCRADAVGLLGEKEDLELMTLLKSCEATPVSSIPVSDPMSNQVSNSDPERPYIAVASLEGMLVNQHLGEAWQLHIYERKNGDVQLLESRPTPEPGAGDKRWHQLAELLGDCRTLLVSGIGTNPRQILDQSGVKVYEVEGIVEDAVKRLFAGEKVNHLVKRKVTKCGAECMGSGMGCG